MAAVAYDESMDRWLTGFAAAEQVMIAAAQILNLVKGDMIPAPADPRAPGWFDDSRALQLDHWLLDEARAGWAHTTTPSDEA